MSILEQLERDLHDAAERRLATNGGRAAAGRQELEIGDHRLRLPRRLRALAPLPLLIAAAIVAVLLNAGASGPSLNVAAAAYAATSLPSGVVEATFVTHVYRGSDAGATLRQREWVQAAGARRRELNTLSEPGARPGAANVSDWVFAPQRWEVWTAMSEPRVIHRTRWTGHGRVPDAHFGFGGLGLYGVEGVQLYRRLYRAGAIRLVGKERYDGRLLWKLESHSARRERESHMRLVVLVDPHTFLPIVVRQLDTFLPGHPTTVESDTLSYRILPEGATNEKLFDLAAQHPGTRVVTRVSAGLRFRAQHRPPRRR